MKQLSITQLPTHDAQLGICQIPAGRQAELQAEQELLSKMLHTRPQLTHTHYGAPLLPNLNISISHTKGYLAILLSPTHHVGIDIEHRSDRIHRIAHRFLRHDEPLFTTNELLAAWCAKEALFKLHHKANLTYQEMKIIPSQRIAIDLRHQTITPYTIEETPDYTLLYMIE